MQFKHPELLYALFLLLIPIIIHLFQFRKFQKEAFTNVAFLKEVSIQTRKSSQLKKWLTLVTRLLLLAAIIFAFAQPFTSKNNLLNTPSEIVIYLDNSFSMQSKGNQGELLKRAVQDIISNVPEDETISLITNESTFKNTTIKAIKNDLLNLDYTSKSLSFDAALLKAKKLFKPSLSAKNILFISDFRRNKAEFNPENDSLFKIHAVQLKPVNMNNISIDSAYISASSNNSIELKIILKNSGESVTNLPVSLFNNDQLIAKTSVNFDKETVTSFSLPENEIINGKIIIEDPDLQYDNSLFFNINKTPKINILSINNADDSFLKRIYNEKEFNFASTPLNQLDYNLINEQNLIVLNELKSIPSSLTSVLKLFSEQGGYLMVIPSEEIDIDTYNSFLSNYSTSLNPISKSAKQITTINYAHPLYANGVFEKRITNFQYPKVNSFYNVSKIANSPILEYEDLNPFLLENNNAYIFSAPLNTSNSNFQNSPLIVPTFYNIGKFSLKNPNLYYTIGNENSFDLSVNLHQDDILSLVFGDVVLIPKQQYYNNKIVITTNEEPSIANIYSVKDKAESIKNVSYNYNREESHLIYQDLSILEQITLSNSVTDIFNTLKSETKVNELWKWFVIFALAFLIIEMLILKYFK
ncbi:BatA and WFA domain-containing protein [Gaetbulibacter aquiaggeris]|uniref:BatA and WFA domain-containing protein n=1 Tax=Gaetbulibacter aquiaggeris TaxID=1735373 RepID=A0ABW7MTP0_9FLAO